jgi:hypothetical protein
MDGWTLEDAAAILDPPMSVPELKALIIAARIAPIGRRPRAAGSAGGRPPSIYDPAELAQAHAALAWLLVRSASPS